MKTDRNYVAVIGAGHAGIEAALASSRMGVPTMLFTMSLDSVGNMPCNPAIGGTGKSQLVYEIDALGGEMGRAADDTAVFLQSRTLNPTKGAAVQSKRIQADRRRYTEYMKRTLEKQPLLYLVQAEITEIITENGVVMGVRTALGEEYEVGAIVVATGTYPNGKIHVGEVNYDAGPDNSLPARGISTSLDNLGIRLMRFKTGTPPRIKASSIDFNALERQDGDAEVTPFSADTPEDAFDRTPQMPCHVVYTNMNTHAVIRDNLHKSAMYSGNITGTGPRYCPSIEDKIVRFADKPRHQLFVEPTGRGCEEMYLQGFSTSMPPDVQYRMLRTLPGFGEAEIMRFAYAIEYDCADPTQLDGSLAFKGLHGLFGAGQFNGTSGYEEAAAQGLLAGINAALYIIGRKPLILPRRSSYLGTLVDDLTLKGTREPYRMMTSRSEFRLFLRQDNADLRLTEYGHEAGLVSDEKYARFREKNRLVEEEIRRISKVTVHPGAVISGGETTPLTTGIRLSELLRRPNVTYKSTAELDPERPILPRAVTFSVETELKYEGYVKKQESEIKRRERADERPLPDGVKYAEIKGLRIEAAQKLDAIKPATLGQASRISGVNPADITVLQIWLSQKRRNNGNEDE